MTLQAQTFSALTLAGVGLRAREGFVQSGAFGHAGRVTLPWTALASACVGNALFHLSARKVLETAARG